MSGFSENKFSNGKSISSDTDLYAELKNISQKCIRCNLCINECEFLRQYGKPGEIADEFSSGGKADTSLAFKCSLCKLCMSICPVDIDPSKMFLEMRRLAAVQGKGFDDECKGILAYERRGVSKRYTWYGLPEGCDTIFFPGCTLPGTRPRVTMALFEHLRKKKPSIGVVLDCCTNISHDLGRQEFFQTKFHEMRRFLVQHGVKNVIVACPSCYKIFSQYGEGLTVTSVYEFLSKNFPEPDVINKKMAVVHDPCALRFNKGVQIAMRDLVNRLGLAISEMPHSGTKTFCCGEGGSVKHLAPDLSKKWAIARGDETGGKVVVTYCAGCSNQLGKRMSTIHVLDLIFNPESALTGKTKISKAPMTYLNRMWLKRRLKKMFKAVENVVTLNEVMGL
jgi:Fe-S oxidoreductase